MAPLKIRAFAHALIDHPVGRNEDLDPAGCGPGAALLAKPDEAEALTLRAADAEHERTLVALV